MSEYELYDLALYGAWHRKDECRRDRNKLEEEHYEKIMELLTDLIVRAELKGGC